MTSTELPPSIHSRLKAICENADRLVEESELSEALALYREAWALIPENWTEWEASTWILSSVGEVYFRMGKFEEALERYSRAVQCPNGIGNPYIHLRLGQLHFELGNLKKAADEFARAFMGAGDEIFQKEDPKYLAFIRTKLRLPAKGE
ncbi:MAG: tetratricopeptide repeat protein [Pirellulaceae bacterium]